MKIILFILLQSAVLFADDSIGKVLAIEGLVKAMAAESAERVLAKGSDIFVKETIVVGSDGRAQIKFTDGGIMNLIPDTEFRINSYRYKKAFQKDETSSELVKGGFRALSGSIAKKNPSGYEVKTPSATIGLRGTMIEVRLGDAGVFFGVDSGRALVSNEAGSSMIGIGEKAQFALVPGNTIPPELILERPRELDFNIFAPPQGGASLDQIHSQQTSPQGPTRGPAEAPPSAGGPTTPSIGETPDDGSTPMMPSGGGAAVGPGC